MRDWSSISKEWASITPPNQGGERVIRTKSKSKAKPLFGPGSAAAESGGESDGFSMRRAIIFGLLAQPAFYVVSGGFRSVPKLEGDAPLLIDDGDAVTSPALELALLEAMEEGSPNNALAANLVERLEANGGVQLPAAAGNGRWVIPWVGGWERLWTSRPQDASFLGGPSRSSFSATSGGRQSTFEQVGARNFVYGPGEGGINVEYLHSTPDGSVNDIVLTRPGSVTNLGGNLFSLDFKAPLLEYEVRGPEEQMLEERRRLKEGIASYGPNAMLQEKLVTGKPLEGGTVQGSPVENLLLKTTYLSERMWIVRDARDESQVAAFTRTETRSVMDRRGLVADGQLKPPDDEGIRYGKLLFGESLQDYAGWEAKEDKERGRMARKLLSN